MSDDVGVLQVTKAGPAANRADLSGVVDTGGVAGGATGGVAGERKQARRIEFVDQRAAVVLYVADSDVEPTRECVETVEAIAEATGRVAVGLFGGGRFAELWRSAIPGRIPMGELDQRMGRTLVLLSDGPPRAVARPGALRRRQAIHSQLAAERSRRAGMAERARAHVRAGFERMVAQVLESVAEGSPRDEAELHRAGARAAAELSRWCGQQGVGAVEMEAPFPAPPVKANMLAEAVVAVMLLAAAAGVSRLLSAPLSWLGLSGVWVQVATVLVGVGFAALAVVATLRRNARQRRGQWVATYLARLRREWLHLAEGAVHARDPAGHRGWRVAQLAEHAN